MSDQKNQTLDWINYLCGGCKGIGAVPEPKTRYLTDCSICQGTGLAQKWFLTPIPWNFLWFKPKRIKRGYGY